MSPLAPLHCEAVLSSHRKSSRQRLVCCAVPKSIMDFGSSGGSGSDSRLNTGAMMEQVKAQLDQQYAEEFFGVRRETVTVRCSVLM